MLFGRNLSASGVAGLLTGNRSLADDIGAFRRREVEKIGGELRIALELGKPNDRALAEMVEDLQCREAAGVKTEPNLRKRRVFVLWRRAQPFQSACRSKIAPLEGALYVLGAREQRGRCRAQRLVISALDDLIEILVIDPDPLAIAHQQLLVRLVDRPAKLARATDGELATRVLLYATGLVIHRLRKCRARGLRLVHKCAQPIERGGIGERGEQA